MNEPNLETLLSANHLCIVPGVHVLAEVLVEVLEPVVEENITLDRTQTHTHTGQDPHQQSFEIWDIWAWIFTLNSSFRVNTTWHVQFFPALETF